MVLLELLIKKVLTFLCLNVPYKECLSFKSKHGIHPLLDKMYGNKNMNILKNINRDNEYHISVTIHNYKKTLLDFTFRSQSPTFDKKRNKIVWDLKAHRIVMEMDDR
eukprot:UN02703